MYYFERGRNGSKNVLYVKLTWNVIVLTVYLQTPSLPSAGQRVSVVLGNDIYTLPSVLPNPWSTGNVIFLVYYFKAIIIYDPFVKTWCLYPEMKSILGRVFKIWKIKTFGWFDLFLIKNEYQSLSPTHFQYKISTCI